MSRPLRPPLLALLPGLLPALVTVPGAASAQPTSGITVSGSWLRVLGPELPAAGYFELSNATAHTVTLVGASSPACGRLSLHQTVHQSLMNGPGGMSGMTGMSSMQAVGTVKVPPHGSVRFAPEGYHLMCEQVGSAVQPGRTVPVTLHIDAGRSITSNFTVEGARGR